MHDIANASSASSTAPPTTSPPRALGLAALAGGLGGLVVGGLFGRVFMFVLAELNPDYAGVNTDDGFPIGRFTLAGTFNLLLVTVVIGVLGGLLFLLLRGLRFGPVWFRVLSMPAGVMVVVGSVMVHSDGVDFAVLEPWWLAVTFTLAVPLLYTLMVAALADRWIGGAPTFWSRLPDPVLWVVRAGFVAFIAFALADLFSTIDEIRNPFRFD